jgi:hypothetical protein
VSANERLLSYLLVKNSELRSCNSETHFKTAARQQDVVSRVLSQCAADTGICLHVQRHSSFGDETMQADGSKQRRQFHHQHWISHRLLILIQRLTPLLPISEATSVLNWLFQMYTSADFCDETIVVDCRLLRVDPLLATKAVNAYSKEEA